ncbi:hypothetical protein V6N13_005828 [Hibiscus sabdariffa]
MLDPWFSACPCLSSLTLAISGTERHSQAASCCSVAPTPTCACLQQRSPYSNVWKWGLTVDIIIRFKIHAPVTTSLLSCIWRKSSKMSPTH